jgi:hypothetical protein
MTRLNFSAIGRFLLWFTVSEIIFLATFSLLYLVFGSLSVLLIVTLSFASTSVLQTILFSEHITFSFKSFIKHETPARNSSETPGV